MIAEMSYVEIVGTKEYLKSLVEILHTFGKLHIEKIPITEDIRETFLHKIHLKEEEITEKKIRGEISDILEDVILHIPKDILKSCREKILLELPEVKEIKERLTSKSFREHYSYSAMIQRRIRSFIRRKNNVEDDLTLLNKYKRVIAIFKKIFPEEGIPSEYDFIGITIDRQQKSLLSIIEEELSRITHEEYKFFYKELDEKKLIIVVGFRKEFHQEVKDFIWNQGIDELKIPVEFKGKPIKEALGLIEERLKLLPKELEEISKEMKNLLEKDGLPILILKIINKDKLSELEAVTLFAQSHYTFVIRGWIPKGEINSLRKELKKNFNDLVIVNELKLSKSDYSKVPILLSNPKRRKPFEKLLAFFPLPKYKTLDATSFIAIFFPLFFGIILADMGYGLILAILSKILSHYAKGRKLLKEISWILLVSSISTIFFGLIFGEFFGDVGRRFGILPLWVEREEAILTLLILAFVIGSIHIIIGLILGVINSYLINNRESLYNNLVKIVVLFGVFFIGGALFEVLPEILFKIGIAILIIFIPLGIKLHGLIAPLEMVSTIGNILSYARIMAIGVASVILAMVANKLGSSFGSLWIGILVAILLHLLNLILGVFSPTIHSLRLHYVEFFSKFYLPGGRKYKPFKRAFI